MPLDHGYGVLIGNFHSFAREDPDSYGNYYHGILKVSTPAGIYTCAIDVDTPNDAVSVEYKLISLLSSDLLPINGWSHGFHALASTSNSGAIDYTRHPAFIPRLSDRIRRLLKWFFMGFLIKIIERWMLRSGRGWNSATGNEALNALESVINEGTISRVLVFGEPFSGGDLGVHNIHQNQGDPSGTPWWTENGIWQDGATIIEKSDGRVTAFINKFSTQSYVTDQQGHPL